MPEAKKARAVDFNHVAIEVGDIDEALAFYGRLFDFKLRGKSKDANRHDQGDWKRRGRRLKDFERGRKEFAIAPGHRQGRRSGGTRGRQLLGRGYGVHTVALAWSDCSAQRRA